MQSKQVLRVVLASPGDVQAERDVTEDVVQEINILLRALRVPALLELYRWETDGRPGMHPLGPQGRLDDILRIEDADILVGVFWQRLGTPVLGAGSGTAHELQQAIAAWKNKGSPQIMLYFRDNPQGIPLDDERYQQYQALIAFKEDLIRHEEPLIWRYADVGDFRNRVKDHLYIEAMGLIGSPHLPLLGLSVEAHPVPVRAEGYTELLGSLFVGFTYNGSAAPPNDLSLTLIVYLPIPVTSRLEQRNPLAYLDAPKIDAILFEVDRPNEESPTRGRLIGPGALMFEGIRLKDLRPQDRRIFRITNLRCNASMVAVGGRIYAHVAATGASVSVEKIPYPTIGTVMQGLVFAVNDASGQERLPSMGFPIRLSAELPPSRIATLHFEEGFRAAFKARTAQASMMSESCFFGSLQQRDHGQVVFSGAADAGTRLKAVFRSVPACLRLFVSTTSLAFATGHIGVQIVGERSSLVPGSVEFVGGLQMQEISIVDGFAKVVWEVIEPNTDWGDHPGHVDVAVCVAGMHGASALLSHAGTAMVNGSFDPTPMVETFTIPAAVRPSSDLPIPRFMDRSIAINITTIQADA